MAISTRLSAVRFRRWSPFPAGEVSNLAYRKQHSPIKIEIAILLILKS